MEQEPVRSYRTAAASNI